MKNRKLTPLAAGLILGGLYRLYPSLYSGLPYSIDAWPLIRDMENLIKYTPIPMESSVFDGYNNYWPGVIIFTSIYSMLLGLNPMETGGFIIPIINILPIILVYLILRRFRYGVSMSSYTAFLISILFPQALFTSGLTKEGYAYPLYILILYTLGIEGGACGYLISILVASTLVFTHHLTLFITSIVAAFISIYLFIDYGFRRGLKGLYTFSILVLGGLIHYYLYGYKGFRIPELRIGMVISFISYMIVFLFTSIYITHTGGGKGGGIRILASLALSMLLSYYVVALGYREEMVRLPPHYMLYIAPYILLGSVSTGYLKHLKTVRERRFIIFWFMSISAILAYSIFGDNPILVGIPYRIVDYLVIPLAILGLSILFEEKFSGKAIAALLTILVLSTSLYGLYSSFHSYDKYLGYNWRNRLGCLEAGYWVEAFNNDIRVSGDSIIKSIFHEYIGLGYTPGLKYFRGYDMEGNLVLVKYDLMDLNGYISGAYSYIEVDSSRLNYLSSMIYDSGIVSMYIGVEGG